MTRPHLDRDAVSQVDPATRTALPNKAEWTFDELLTVDEVAARLKVSRTWVYEHTRARVPRIDRLPFVKIGKYVRFHPKAVADFLAKRTRIA